MTREALRSSAFEAKHATAGDWACLAVAVAFSPLILVCWLLMRAAGGFDGK